LPPEKRNPTEDGGARFLKGFDLLGGDQHQDSEAPSELQARRIARLFFLSPDVAATIARLHFGEARV
jgi:hypothetical protein